MTPAETLPVGAAATATAGAMPRRAWGRRHAAFFSGVVALLGAMLALVARQSWPALNAEERARVGTWYGYIRDTSRNYCWVTELRADRTCTISFRHFHAQRIPGGTGWSAGSVDVSVGRWEIVNRTYATRTWFPGQQYGLVARVGMLLTSGQWLGRSVEHYEYRVEPSSPERFEYSLTSPPVTFRAVRVPDGFAVPEEPVTPEDARARTGQSGTAVVSTVQSSP